MEGILLKWTNYIFGWRERFFVLRGSILYYYYKKSDRPKGRIHLGVTSITSSDDEPKFELDTGISVIYLKANTLEEKNTWVQAIKLAKLEAEKNLTAMSSQNLSKVNFEESSLQTPGRNSVITEDKLLRKINNIQQTAEKLQIDSQSFGEFLRQNEEMKNNQELNGIYKKLKVVI
jgi:collagen type IV alpha-3-binding protein